MFANTYLFLLLVCLMSLARSEELCKEVGLICSQDEKSINFCPKVNGTATAVEKCPDGEKCKAEKGSVKCVDPKSVNLRFECTGKGEFPDPQDCSRTYICNADKGKPAEECKCPSGSYVYPEAGLFCVPGKCPRKNITCSEGLSGHFELEEGGKTSFFYYCTSSDAVTVYGNVYPMSRKVELPAAFRAMKNGKDCIPYKSTPDEEVTTTLPTTESTTAKETDEPTTTANSTQPTQTTKPTDPTKPTEPTDPTKPTETTKPTDPTQTTKPTDPTKPTEPTDPTQTTKPTDPTKPTEPTDPTQTTKPTEPTQTTEPTQPTKPTTQAPEVPKCNSPGEIYPSECDCDYFHCDKNLKPNRRTCLNGLRFVPKYKKCVFGECDESKCTGRPPKRISAFWPWT